MQHYQAFQHPHHDQIQADNQESVLHSEGRSPRFFMIQQILQQSDWLSRMTAEDKRAMSPLLTEHINPYGIFIVNFQERLALDHPPLRIP